MERVSETERRLRVAFQTPFWVLCLWFSLLSPCMEVSAAAAAVVAITVWPFIILLYNARVGGGAATAGPLSNKL